MAIGIKRMEGIEMPEIKKNSGACKSRKRLATKEALIEKRNNLPVPMPKAEELEIHFSWQMLKILNASSGEAIDDGVLNKLFNLAYRLANGIDPKDPIEAMLGAQIAATHEMAMTFLYRSGLPEQTLEGVTTNIDRATKLSRTFTTQIEALNRYRGKGQQKVTVEHVTVNQGGQAVIGTVERPEGGGGNEQK